MATQRRPSSCWVGVVLLLGVAALSSLAVAATTFPAGSYDSEGYTITFEKTGTFRYVKGDRLMVEGEFAAKDGEISLRDKSGVDACVGPGLNPGTYRWKLDADSLSFTTIHDSCNERIRGLTGQQWKRKPDRGTAAR
jgi:hypothetical protein